MNSWTQVCFVQNSVEWPDVQSCLWIGFTVAGIFLPLSLGLGLFILGLINYLILLSFRLGNYFFTKQALVDAGAWDPFNVTEDADLSVRL